MLIQSRSSTKIHTSMELIIDIQGIQNHQTQLGLQNAKPCYAEEHENANSSQEDRFIEIQAIHEMGHRKQIYRQYRKL